MASKKTKKPLQESVFLLAANGTVEIVEGDQTWTLRRPKIGELKTLREQWVDVAAKQKELAASLKDGSADEAEVQAAVDLLNAELVDSLFAELGSPSATYDELPSYFSNPATLATILNHFQTIPLVRG